MGIVHRLKALLFPSSAKPAERAVMPLPELARIQETPEEKSFSNTARECLKEATALKREKKYGHACEKLREAYAAEGAENLMIEDRLRLPMYLLLAGKNDEGWDELNRLNALYVDEFSQPRIANQMRVFRTKEGKGRAAIPVVARTGTGAGPESSENANTGSFRMTVGELQNRPLSAWGNPDIVSGLKFSATLQLRTPLRILLRHGDIHIDGTKPAPKITREPWEGIWYPVMTSAEEACCGPDSTDEEIQFYKRLDAGLANANTVASDVGPIREDNYLPFLVAVRKIIEADDTIERRIELLREMSFPTEWRVFLNKHGEIDGIIDRFFPHFMHLAPGLNTPNRIAAAPDKALLAIKGIGPARLRAIRDCCAGITTNRDGDRVDLVKT